MTSENCGHKALAATSSGSRNVFLSLSLSALFLLLCLALTMHSVARSHSASFNMVEPGWVSMPAGARSAFLGIHGGTVPVSLMATPSGTSFISFVGQTGNDFLALLRNAELRLPSFLTNATRRTTGGLLGKTEPLPGSSQASLQANLPSMRLFAGSGHTSLPVISLSDESVFSLAARPGVKPFGLSAKPLPIEGSVPVPSGEGQSPRYHLLAEPEHLTPR